MIVIAKTLRQGNDSKSGSSPIPPTHRQSNKRKGKLLSSVMSLCSLP